jgi:ribose 5-phosphate isomerase B
MHIAIASDHGGFELKESIKKHLEKKHIKFTDYGTNSLASVDYPDFAYEVGKVVLDHRADFGILICGTGIGISIAANKIDGIRAALVYDENTAHLAKAHNNANIIALGGRTTSSLKANKIVDAYLKAVFEERHQHRIDKIHAIEGEKYE